MTLALSRQAAGIARSLLPAAGALLIEAGGQAQQRGGQAHQLQSTRSKMSHSEASESPQRCPVMRDRAAPPLSPPLPAV